LARYLGPRRRLCAARRRSLLLGFTDLGLARQRRSAGSRAFQKSSSADGILRGFPHPDAPQGVDRRRGTSFSINRVRFSVYGERQPGVKAGRAADSLLLELRQRWNILSGLGLRERLDVRVDVRQLLVRQNFGRKG